MAKRNRPAPPRPHTLGGGRHARREIQLPGGDTLVLKPDGSIDRMAADSGPTQTWRPGDPEWASHAIRFGLRQQPRTVAPTGRSVEGTKPPRR